MSIYYRPVVPAFPLPAPASAHAIAERPAIAPSLATVEVRGRMLRFSSPPTPASDYVSHREISEPAVVLRHGGLGDVRGSVSAVKQALRDGPRF